VCDGGPWQGADIVQAKVIAESQFPSPVDTRPGPVVFIGRIIILGMAHRDHPWTIGSPVAAAFKPIRADNPGINGGTRVVISGKPGRHDIARQEAP